MFYSIKGSREEYYKAQFYFSRCFICFMRQVEEFRRGCECNVTQFSCTATKIISSSKLFNRQSFLTLLLLMSEIKSSGEEYSKTILCFNFFLVLSSILYARQNNLHVVVNAPMLEETQCSCSATKSICLSKLQNFYKRELFALLMLELKSSAEKILKLSITFFLYDRQKKELQNSTAC